MKLSEAKRIIHEGGFKRPRGYRVHFEKIDGKFLMSDYFPERNEPLIEYEEEAWALAASFAAKTFGQCINIYVVDERWAPVDGYWERKIVNR